MHVSRQNWRGEIKLWNQEFAKKCVVKLAETYCYLNFSELGVFGIAEEFETKQS